MLKPREGGSSGGSGRDPVQAFLNMFWAIVNGVWFFFASLLSPEGGQNYSKYGSRKRWDGGNGGNGGGRGGGGGGGGGPRISGLGNLPSSGGQSCGGCGCG